MTDLDYPYIASLVERAKTRDSDAFAELYVATYQKQYRFACNYLRDEYLAQDALQETYILVLKNLASLKDSSLFISWLNQITFRVCFNMQKKQKRHKEEISDYDPSQMPAGNLRDANPEDYLIEIDQKEFIIRQVLSLPFTESQVIILRYYNNMKLADIARLMDMSRSSVKRYLNSGKKKLEQLLACSCQKGSNL